MTGGWRFDPGLQPERTELAWRRTAISIAVGSLLCARLLPEMLQSGSAALLGIAGLAFSAWLWLASRRRARRMTTALRDDHRPPGAGLLLTVTVFVVLCGALGLTLLLIHR